MIERQDMRAGIPYRSIISLLLGLIGFGVNFYAIHFDFPPYQASLLPGLVFPMLVALAWGWPYGLLSATLGLGCQTMWFVWLEQRGWEPLITIPMLTLWVVWHGWCAIHPKNSYPHLHHFYVAEIPFRIFNSVVLYTFLYAALQWPPPSWAPHSAMGGQALNLIHFRAVEQAVAAYVVLLMADVFLNLGPIRKLFGLKQRAGQMTTSYVISAALLFGLLFWIIDGLMDYYKFREQLRFLLFRSPENVFDSMLFNVPSPDLFARIVFLATCLAGGVLVSRLLRKQLESESALRESKVRYRRLHETMRDAFVQIDMSGRIVDFNHAFHQMLGYAGEKLLGMKEAQLTPVKWRAADAEIVDGQVVPQGRSKVYEKEYIRANGSVFPVELRTFLIDDDSQAPIGMWSIVRDITLRKKTELERERAMVALKQSNEDLKQFAYVASHDLQEPLRMVASYTQLLAENYGNQLDEKAHKFIHYAVDGASRMQALIRDLLAFSRVETHAEVFQKVDAHSVLGVAVANLKAVIDETGALVTNGDLPQVRADPTQLTQLFQNLISNSIKFRNQSSAPRVHVSAQRQNGSWCFSIQDNGIGIESKYKEKVFIVFQRLHTRQEYPGTGIGLALCKRIIDRHRGEIWFNSLPGRGTTFHFTLPI